MMSEQVKRYDGQMMLGGTAIAAGFKTGMVTGRDYDALRTELEAARGLLGMMASALYEERNEHEDTPAHILNATNAYEMWMAVTPAPEALAEQGERQEAVEVVVPAKLTGATGFAKDIEDGWNAAIDAVLRLNATPHPGPDARGLVEALEPIGERIAKVWIGHAHRDELITIQRDIDAALAAHRQAQQGGSHG